MAAALDYLSALAARRCGEREVTPARPPRIIIGQRHGIYGTAPIGIVIHSSGENSQYDPA